MIAGSRWDEPFREWRCTDCDPTIFPDEDNEYEKPYVLLLPMEESSPDYCPRCASYLSFTEGDTELRITNTVAERYARKQAEG